MKVLICLNEDRDIVSTHISTNAKVLNDKMKREYELELIAVESEGYESDEVESDFVEGDHAFIIASDNYQYYWEIHDCVEV